jgi:hypothetical protein
VLEVVDGATFGLGTIFLIFWTLRTYWVSVAGLKEFCCIWHLFIIVVVTQKEFYILIPPGVVLHRRLSRQSLHRKVRVMFSGDLCLTLNDISYEKWIQQ